MAPNANHIKLSCCLILFTRESDITKTQGTGGLSQGNTLRAK